MRPWLIFSLFLSDFSIESDPAKNPEARAGLSEWPASTLVDYVRVWENRG